MAHSKPTLSFSQSMPSRLMTYLGFIPISLASFAMIWGYLLGSGLPTKLSQMSSSDLFMHTSFFQTAMDPSIPPFFCGFVSSLAILALIPYAESLRSERPRNKHILDRIVLNPFLTNAVAQMFGGAFMYPLYWASFICSGEARKYPAQASHSEIPQAAAESLLFSFVLGFILPSTLMKFFPNHSYIVTLWWAFPLTITLLQYLYITFRPKISSSTSAKSLERAYFLTQGTYLIAFLFSTVFHLSTLIPMFNPIRTSLPRLINLLVPPLRILPPTPSPVVALQIMQVDSLFLFAGAIMMTLVAFPRTWKEAGKLAAWNVFGVVVCGTGGAIAGVWMWREWRLMGERRAVDNSHLPKSPRP
ncbi:hypothetical protein SISSUDRAFT_1044357 [Sistotremastrum suecicum HHB10207 ss-3]|uniref:Uncharacterized protein n=1 Tax=Sistotremastrum suecicum HHB10207 ss-3 TaxID=1314776 RepID=A0A166F9X6_9AGAM|nr:hypothetical protein SISSUDRAFT_1044357 [Sistotremastrum suecicum HHB10207 ss-3]